MKKKLTALALFFTLLTVFVPWRQIYFLTVSAAEESDFVINRYGVLTAYTGAGGNVVIPEGVTQISNKVFCNCKALTGVIIPDSVTSIGNSAFKGCTGLTGVDIPDSVKWIESEAFMDCSGMTGITIGNSVTSIGVGAFQGCTGLTDVAVPHSVTSINWSAFMDCTGLRSIVIPDSVTSIGWKSFMGCTGLKSIVIPDSVTKIDECAFSYCTGLTSVTIPDSVTVIRSWAFEGCTGLTRVILPDSLTSIDDDAFSDTDALKDVYYAGTEQQWRELTNGDAETLGLNSSVRIHYNSTDTPLKLTAQPANASGAVNDTAQFTVKAVGLDVSYQWYMKKANESAFTAWNRKTSASVSTPVYASWNNAQFYCLVKDANGASVKSNTVKLTVTPKITAQPVNASGAVNDNVSFTVKATGAGLSYQWYMKKADQSTFTAWNKRTTASVSTPIYASWNNAQFYCLVKDANGKTVQSNTVKLTVTPKITAQPVNASGAVNDNVSFTVKATGSGLTYQWYMKKANESSFTAWNRKTSASVSTPVYASWNNTQFHCVVKDANGKTVQSDTVKLTVTPKITSQPVGVSGAVNGTATFTVKATGAGLKYQWYYKKAGESNWTKWNNQTGASASLTIYKSWNNAQFYCLVKDANGKTVKSSTAALTVR